MAETAPALIMREAHRLRQKARDLQEQLERGPRLLKAHQAKVTRQETLLREEQEAIKKLKVATHEKEVSLKTTHNLIAKHQKQLGEAAAKKEYDALQNEIAVERARTGQLEDEILAAMTEAEERTAKLPELDKAVRQAKEESAAFEKGTAERNAGLSADLAQTQAKLGEVEATVPANIRTQYNRIVTAMGADGFAAVRDRNCAACHAALTAQHYIDLQQNLFSVCRSCGRILYLPE
jgi:predicted  nucleic acid-binding Zn-ribbon protein